MTTLKDALKNNKLNDFIKARSKEEKKGDKEKFDKAIKSISQKLIPVCQRDNRLIF